MSKLYKIQEVKILVEYLRNNPKSFTATQLKELLGMSYADVLDRLSSIKAENRIIFFYKENGNKYYYHCHNFPDLAKETIIKEQEARSKKKYKTKTKKKTKSNLPEQDFIDEFIRLIDTNRKLRKCVAKMKAALRELEQDE